MIIRTVHGRSFKGVGQYVLHDKKANTDERVAFTEVMNLPTANPRVALAHMIDTATHANDLKRGAGVKIGKKIERPVYHYTLSWEVNETPSQADQIEAARESLKALGIADRQALIVAHTDTDNPHVHVVVNTVCPETGRVAKLGNDRFTLSRWAEDYRKRMGLEHFCPNRTANNERRQKGEWVKDTKSLTRQEWTAWKKQQTKQLWEEYRADRDTARAGRKGQYDALWRQKEERLSARKGEIKTLFKPNWRDVFQQQRKVLQTYDNRLSERLKFALNHYDQGRFMAVIRAFTRDHGQRADFMREQENERKALGKIQQQTIADSAREITKAWKYDRDQLKNMHRQEDETRLSSTKAKVADTWANDIDKPAPKTREEKLDEIMNPKREKPSEAAARNDEEKRRRNRTRKPRPR